MDNIVIDIIIFIALLLLLIFVSLYVYYNLDNFIAPNTPINYMAINNVICN